MGHFGHFIDFGHFINFGHFPIEIPTEAEKFYGKWKEGLYIKNKNSFEIGEHNGTACRYVQVKKRKNSEQESPYRTSAYSN